MTPAPGDRAADFSSRNQHGEPLALQDLAGGPAVLVFYPWAFSGVCRGELSELRSLHEQFVARGARVVAVSCDSMYSLRAYADSEGIDFDLVSDHWPHGAIARAYGVFDEQVGCALRGSFLLDADGIVRYASVNGIGEARSMADLLERVPGLG